MTGGYRTAGGCWGVCAHVRSVASPCHISKGTRGTEGPVPSASNDPGAECVWSSHIFDKWLGVGLEARASRIPFPSLGYKFLHGCGKLRSLFPFLPLQNRDCGHVCLEASEKQAAPSYFILSRCVWLRLLPRSDLRGFLVALLHLGLCFYVKLELR